MKILRILALVLPRSFWYRALPTSFEMPGKVGLDRNSYFIVQGIYAGWSLFAVPIFAALL